MKILNYLFRKPFHFLACLFLGMLVTTSVQAVTVVNATIVEDTYVKSDEPDTNFDDEVSILMRNYNTFGRASVIQFNLPQLPAGKTAADITSVDLSGIVAFTGAAGRSVTLRVSGLGVNPDLTTVTYGDLSDSTGNGVFTDYLTGIVPNFTYGSLATSLDTLASFC